MVRVQVLNVKGQGFEVGLLNRLHGSRRNIIATTSRVVILCLTLVGLYQHNVPIPSLWIVNVQNGSKGNFTPGQNYAFVDENCLFSI